MILTLNKENNNLICNDFKDAEHYSNISFDFIKYSQ